MRTRIIKSEAVVNTKRINERVTRNIQKNKVWNFILYLELFCLFFSSPFNYIAINYFNNLSKWMEKNTGFYKIKADIVKYFKSPFHKLFHRENRPNGSTGSRILSRSFSDFIDLVTSKSNFDQVIVKCPYLHNNNTAFIKQISLFDAALVLTNT